MSCSGLIFFKFVSEVHFSPIVLTNNYFILFVSVMSYILLFSHLSPLLLCPTSEVEFLFLFAAVMTCILYHLIYFHHSISILPFPTFHFCLPKTLKSSDPTYQDSALCLDGVQ